MMGIPVEGSTFVFEDKQLVLSNVLKPYSSLKIKSSSIAFRFVLEGVEKDKWRTNYLNTALNPTDICKKSLPGKGKRARFTSHILHYIYEVSHNDDGVD